MSKDDEVQQNLFSLGHVNRHATEKADLEPGQHVEFRGSGAVVGVSYDGFASEDKLKTRLYKITVDFLELI